MIPFNCRSSCRVIVLRHTPPSIPVSLTIKRWPSDTALQSGGLGASACTCLCAHVCRLWIKPSELVRIQVCSVRRSSQFIIISFCCSLLRPHLWAFKNPYYFYSLVWRMWSFYFHKVQLFFFFLWPNWKLRVRNKKKKSSWTCFFQLLVTRGLYQSSSKQDYCWSLFKTSNILCIFSNNSRPMKATAAMSISCGWVSVCFSPRTGSCWCLTRQCLSSACGWAHGRKCRQDARVFLAAQRGSCVLWLSR